MFARTSLAVGMMLLGTACGAAPAADVAEGEAPLIGAHALRPFAPELKIAMPGRSPAVASSFDGDIAVSPLALDACDEPDYAGVAWKQADRGNFTFVYLPGTAAENDLEQIAVVRNNLYTNYAKLFNVDPGKITMVLSPNRVAAARAGYSMAYARPWRNQIEVLYLGTPDSSEMRAPGHEVAHIITSKIDSAANIKIPLLVEGIAEYLDASGRDHHADYVQTLRAGIDADYTARFTDYDVRAYNYERSASFVKFLVERYGMPKFIQLWRAATVTYVGSSYKLASGGDIIATGDALERAFGTLAKTVYDTDFATLRGEWEATLKPYFSKPIANLTTIDQKEIANVIANVDAAQSNGDASMFRTAMEGFYCEWENDDKRMIRARNATESRGAVTSEIVSALPANARFYPRALVHTVRREERDGVVTTTTVQFWMEHFPLGWRITWMSGW